MYIPLSFSSQISLPPLSPPPTLPIHLHHPSISVRLSVFSGFVTTSPPACLPTGTTIVMVAVPRESCPPGSPPAMEGTGEGAVGTPRAHASLSRPSTMTNLLTFDPGDLERDMDAFFRLSLHGFMLSGLIHLRCLVLWPRPSGHTQPSLFLSYFPAARKIASPQGQYITYCAA